MVAVTLTQVLFDRVQYIEQFLHLRDKEAHVIPFELNVPQRKIIQAKEQAIAQGKPARFLVLKARREGVTTLEQALNFHKVATEPNTQVVTLAHEAEATEKIFRIANLFYERLDPKWRPARLSRHNKRTLDFPLMNSLFYIGTAGARAFGRGDTLNRVHGSEVAWWPGGLEDHRALMAGLSEACSHGEIVLESTPNGIGNFFHQTCMEALSGQSEWTLIFLPWWEDPGNRFPLDHASAREIMGSLTKDEQALVHAHGLDAEQIAWRRAKQLSLKSLFIQEYPEDPESCFLVSGHCYFDKTLLATLLRRAPEPAQIRGDGEIVIWKRPVPGRAYAGGADTSEGTPTGNFSVLSILDVETMEPVARLRGRWKPEDFAARCARLGQEYNWALLAVERNNHGHSTLNTLANQLHYPNLYFHKDYDQKTGKAVPTIGFPTNTKTRPLMLSGLRTAVEDGLMPMPDKVFLTEAMTFVKVGDRYEADEGCEDDTVISYAISLMAREAALNEVGEIPLDFDGSGMAPRIFQSPQGRIF